MALLIVQPFFRLTPQPFTESWNGFTPARLNWTSPNVMTSWGCVDNANSRSWNKRYRRHSLKQTLSVSSNTWFKQLTVLYRTKLSSMFYSNNLNTGLVQYSNGQKLSSHRFWMSFEYWTILFGIWLVCLWNYAKACKIMCKLLIISIVVILYLMCMISH